MRALVLFCLLSVLSLQVELATAAESAAPATSETATPTPPIKSDDSAVKIVQPVPAVQLADPGKQFALGDTLKIKVADKLQISIVNAKAPGVLLVLDDVVMTSLGAPLAGQDLAGGGLMLSFRLAIDPNSDTSRNEWSHLLEKPGIGYTMHLPIALAIGPAAAMPVAGDGLWFSITSQLRADITLAVGFLVLVLLFWWLTRQKSALRDSPNGPFSLGKSQMAFWGLLVAIAFIGVWINTGLVEHIPPQVLILLGISSGTGLGALVIGNGTRAAAITALNAKLATVQPNDAAGRAAIQNDLQALQSPTDQSRGFWYDICDGGNGVGFHRLQTVIWTLILGVLFVAKVAKVITMPEFPDTLLTLMGISNSVYLGFKFPEKA